MGKAEWTMLLVLSTLWGGSYFLISIALDDLPPFTLVLSRVLLGAIALNLVVLLSGQRMPRSAKLWGPFLVMGALNNLLPFSLISWGQTEIASGLAAILTATTPVFAVLLGHVLVHGERLTRQRVAGVVLGITGVTTMIGIGALEGLSAHLLAELAIVGAALSYASAGIFGRRFKGTPLLVVAAGQLTATTLLMAPIALVVDRPWTLAAPGTDTIGAVLALALLSTALAYVLYFRILSVAGSTNIQLVTFLIPVTALLLGMFALNESLGGQHLLGMGLIALGLIAIDGRLLPAVRRLVRRKRMDVDIDIVETGY